MARVFGLKGGRSTLVTQTNSMRLEGSEQRLKERLVSFPSPERMGMDGLADLHQAGRPDHARVEWNSRQAGSHSSPMKSIRRRACVSTSRTRSS